MIWQGTAEPGASEAVAPCQEASYRWVICLLLFLVATINYIARQAIGLLKTTLRGEIGWNEIGYSNIIFGFQLAYAIGPAPFREADGPAGNPQGILVVSRAVELCSHGACARVFSAGIRHCALRLGIRPGG